MTHNIFSDIGRHSSYTNSYKNNRENNHKSKEIDNTLIPRYGGACFFRFLWNINKIATDGGGGAVVAEVIRN